MAVHFKEQVYDAAPLSDVEDASVKPQSEEWKPSGHELLIIITLAIVSLLVALDASIIVTSLGAMVVDLKADTTAGFWIGTSYLLVNAVTMPIIASLSEIFGRPICLEFALLSFTVGTIFCSTANSVTLMLVGRCIQGIGGGGVHVLSGVIMTDIVPLRFRPKWFGVVLGAWALGTCIGPLIGGAIVEHTTWRWVFYLMFPICAYGLVAVPLLLTLAPREESMGQKLLRVDWFGGFLFMGSATSFLVAICWGGSQKPWDSAATIAPLVIGLVGLGCTLVWEIKFAKEPIFKHELFNSRSSAITYICGACQGFLMWGAFYYFPFYFLSVMQTSTITAGVNLLPSVLITVPGSIITGRLVTRFNNYRYFVWAGWAIVVLNSILAVIWKFVNVTTAVWATTFVVFGLGHGMILNAQQFAVQAMCNPGDEGLAASMYLFLRQIGAAIGVGVGGSVFQNVMSIKLQWEGLDKAIASEAEGYVIKLHTMPNDDPVKEQILEAFRYGFAGVYDLYLGIAGVALILSLLFVKHYDLNRTLGTEHVLRESRTSKMLIRDSKLSSAVSSRAPSATPSRWSSNTRVDQNPALEAEMTPLDQTDYHRDVSLNALQGPHTNAHSTSNVTDTDNIPTALQHQRSVSRSSSGSGYTAVQNGYNPSQFPTYSTSQAAATVIPQDPSSYFMQQGGYIPQTYYPSNAAHASTPYTAEATAYDPYKVDASQHRTW
ncbi:major facilitator superfamily domain-containing protein [Truncatella angustata]|uniref:Major facilitator superfamily domain-containing protein n=1 Tax=Truncatella angustata TaxID=152316 RepID=A0A9P8UHQ4_9PEZI|nr:major facilitator superfamily domain-containing protein [Truncatella angustata]KAH6652318.1 major facilitator superfamily domain-containing protein [Truncatella angustata]